MKIQTVSIDGFKNLSNVMLRLDDITALVALNSFGKSNVLSGIEFAVSFMRADTKRRAWMMARTDLMPMSRCLIGRNFHFRIEFLTLFSGKNHLVQYEYSFSWKNSEDDNPGIISERLELKEEGKSQKCRSLILRNKNTAKYRSSETGRCSAGLAVSPRELAVNKLLALENLFFTEILTKLNSIRICTENNFNADNLPGIIYNLKKNNPEKFELLEDAYAQLFPHARHILVERIPLNVMRENQAPEDIPYALANQICVLLVDDDTLAGPINFQLMSAGAKRVFMILAGIILSGEGSASLIFIEEPENSVHPGLIQAYINVIHQLLDDCSAIITSHSPWIVSCLNPSWIRIGYSDAAGIAEFFPLRDDARKTLENEAAKFDMSFGDYLFSILSDPDGNAAEYLERSIIKK